MKKFSAFALLAFALISLNACRKVVGEGPVIKENRNTSNFSGIVFDVPGELIYIPGNDYKIEIEAQQNILNVIETSVSNNDLKIRVRNNTNIRSHEDIRITVTAPNVKLLALSGSGVMRVLQGYKPDNVKLVVSGSGKIAINMLEANKIDAVLSGSGDLEVQNGVGNTTDITVSGSGSVNLENVFVDKATTQTSGSGTIKLNVGEELFSRISGSGTVYYKGSPTVNTSISGSGRVVRF